MEQFLLSPEVAVQQTAQTQSVSNSATGNDGESFEPILQDAVSDQEELVLAQTELTETTEVIPTEGIQIEGIQTEAIITPLISIDLSKISLPEITHNPGHAKLSNPESSFIQTSLPQNPLQLNSSTETTDPVLSSTLTEVSEAAVTLSASSFSGSAHKAETILLLQIQDIIDKNKNVGAISIKSEKLTVSDDKKLIDNLHGLSSTTLQETESETIQIRHSNTNFVLPDEQKTFSSPVSRPESNRQEVTEQFINAKFGESKVGIEQHANNKQNEQKGSNGQNTPNSLNTTPATAGTADANTSDTGFVQQLRSNDVVTPSPTSTIEGKFAPGATTTVIPERELVDTIIQRFNINPRLQTSKLSLQLHPAELGQIKMDILVKGDTISANIIAQSQQVMDTLDKNLNRLRGVLEDQGFKIDSFEVTLQTNENSQQNLFQEEFDSQQQFTTNSQETLTQGADSFENILENEANESEFPESQINLTA